MKRERNVTKPYAVKKRETFREELKAAFKAYHAHAETIINEDPQKTEETKRENIVFLLDQKSRREAKIASTANKIYTQKVIMDGMQKERKRKRESDMEQGLNYIPLKMLGEQADYSEALRP